METLLAWGVPTAATGLIASIVLFLFKRYFDQRDAKAEKREKEMLTAMEEREKERLAAAEEREKNFEQVMLLMMKNARATYVLSRATAVAVQRIPDAKCNGDMKKALAKAEEIQKQEQDLLLDQGVKRIFGD